MYFNRMALCAAAKQSQQIKRNVIPIQIVSDIHTELYPPGKFPRIESHAPYLALAGDIGDPTKPSFLEFFKDVSKKFESVFYVAGNHEYYNDKLNRIQIDDLINDKLSKFSNVHFLQRKAHFIDKTFRILGCTLWSPSTPETFDFMGDSKKIIPAPKELPFTWKTVHNWYFKDVVWLHENLDQCMVPTFVITHHGPLPRMAGRFENSEYSSGYVSDLHRFFQDPLVGWLSGHVHDNVTLLERDILSVSNAMGYPNETGINYQENKVILV